MVIGVRRRLPRSSSELADVGTRPEFTSLESQVRTPRHELTGHAEAFLRRAGHPRHCGHQTIDRAPASLIVKPFARRRTVDPFAKS